MVISMKSIGAQMSTLMFISYYVAVDGLVGFVTACLHITGLMCPSFQIDHNFHSQSSIRHTAKRLFDI